MLHHVKANNIFGVPDSQGEAERVRTVQPWMNDGEGETIPWHEKKKV